MKLRRGLVVKVEFSDHVEGSSNSIRFVVYGRVVSVTRRTLSLDSWAYADSKQKFDRNQTRFAIVRSSIHRIVRLVEDRVLFDEKNQ